jgi:hypothetical protein
MAVKKVEKKATTYVVLRSETLTGPFSVVGNWTTNGQITAKKAAAAQEAESGNDPEKAFFVAIPASSFYPQKPTVQMVITFLSDDGSEEPEDESETEEQDEPGEDFEPDVEAFLADQGD